MKVTKVLDCILLVDKRYAGFRGEEGSGRNFLRKKMFALGGSLGSESVFGISEDLRAIQCIILRIVLRWIRALRVQRKNIHQCSIQKGIWVGQLNEGLGSWVRDVPCWQRGYW